MANSKNDNKEELKNEQPGKKEESAVEKGKKAIEANKQFNTPGKSEEEKNEMEKKDAEQWRNEG